MLRAGKSVFLQQSIISSDNGIILAPIININGLILRADNPIPEPIKAFLQESGAEAGRVRYKGELLIRIKGIYKLRKEDISAFIEANSELIEAQKIGLESVPEAVKLREEIRNSVASPCSLKAKIGRHSYIYGLIDVCELNLNIRDTALECGLTRSQNLTAKCPQFTMQGGAIEGHGFLAKYEIAQKARFFGSAHIRNAAIEAGHSLSIKPIEGREDSTVSLSLEQGVAWVNTPCLG